MVTYDYLKKACFYVSVGDVTLSGNKDNSVDETLDNNSNTPSESSSVGIKLPESMILKLFLLFGIAFLPILLIRKEIKLI